MQTNDALAALNRYQSAILATIGGAVRLVDGEPAAVQAPLAKARWHVARQLREYQVFKHGEIFGPVVRYGAVEQARMAERAAERCVATGDAFTAYLRHWSSRDVVGQWDEYRPAMKAITARLRDTLAAERIQVPRLLAGADRTRQLRR